MTWATDRTSFGVSKLKRRLRRLNPVYTCQNATLLEITCLGSYVFASADFFKINYFKEIFQEQYQSVKLLGSSSGSKLFAKVINR